MRLASSPVEAKAHGAWLGAGTGVGLAQAAVAVIQAALGHPLAQGYVTGIYVVAGPLLAFIGAYLAPHTSRPPGPSTTFVPVAPVPTATTTGSVKP